MTATYDKIATYTAPSAQASYTFTAIPNTYTDLILIVDGSLNSNVVGIGLRFNSDTASNYSDTLLLGNGSSAASGRNSNQTFANIGYSGTSGARFINRAQIQNYSNSTTFKTTLARHDQPAEQTIAWLSVWRKTPEVINSVQVLADGSNFNTGSTFTLYGIKAE
jgi:hypothetical protein